MTLMCASLAVRSVLAQVSLRVNVSYKFCDNHVLNALRNKREKRYQIYTTSQVRHPSLFVYVARLYTGSRLYLYLPPRDLTVDGNIVSVRQSVTQQRNSDISRLTVGVPRAHTIRYETR